MAETPVIASEDAIIAQPISWEALISRKAHFMGGDCSWESKEHETIRGPVTGMVLNPTCLEVEMAWTARSREEEWYFMELESQPPFIAPRYASRKFAVQPKIFTDGRVIMELNGDRMILYPKSWKDRLKPEYVVGFQKQ
jgi:hypothetical protein